MLKRRYSLAAVVRALQSTVPARADAGSDIPKITALGTRASSAAFDFDKTAYRVWSLRKLRRTDVECQYVCCTRLVCIVRRRVPPSAGSHDCDAGQHAIAYRETCEAPAAIVADFHAIPCFQVAGGGIDGTDGD